MNSNVVLITGAGGFIGRATVLALSACGYQVRAVVRTKASIPEDWQNDPNITPEVCDLSSGSLDMTGVYSILHFAASLSGDDADHARDTLAATVSLLNAIGDQSNPPALILLSSIAVYDTLSLPVGGILDETTPIEPNPVGRDAYCRAKIAQELLAQEAAKRDGFALTILRPGAVFGETRVWNDHIGVPVGPLLLRFGKHGQVPLCALDHLTATLVRAVETPPSQGEGDVINVLDDDLPNRVRFVQTFRSGGWPKWVLPLPWRVLDGLAGFLAWFPFLADRLPGLLRRQVLHARLKPLKYSNARLHARYSVESKDWFETAMLRALDPNVFGPQND